MRFSFRRIMNANLTILLFLKTTDNMGSEKSFLSCLRNCQKQLCSFYICIKENAFPREGIYLITCLRYYCLNLSMISFISRALLLLSSATFMILSAVSVVRSFFEIISFTPSSLSAEAALTWSTCSLITPIE